MNPHFFTAPFYFAFIWFRVQGSRFKVQGSGFRWRLRRLILEDGRKPLPSFLMRAELSFIARLAALACAAHYS